MQRNSLIKFEDGLAYFDENGTLYYGWLTIDGESYYFNGRVVTGLNELFRDDRYSYFYFDEQGKMVSNQMISVGEYKYYFGEDGRIVDGFVTINGNTYSSLGHFVHINHSGYSLF